MSVHPIGVLIVNDSAVASQTLRRILMRDPRYRVVGIAPDGFEAERMVRSRSVNLVLMDIHMPGMGGVEATRRIMATRAVPILIVTATVTRNMSEVFECLRHGALEAIRTPVAIRDDASPLGPEAIHLLERMAVVASLRSTIDRARSDGSSGIAPAQRRGSPQAATPPPRPPDRVQASPGQVGVRVVAIGASTGGPTALATILRGLPRGFRPSVLIVQHIEPGFTQGLADWLGNETPLPVVEADGGQAIREGCIYLARGGHRHLVLTPGWTLSYEPAQPGDINRPSVDRLFDSVARACGGQAAGVLCTGMGEDGARGLLAMHKSGAYTLAQNQSSCLIYGMPGAAVRLGAVRRECHLDEIAPALLGLAGVR